MKWFVVRNGKIEPVEIVRFTKWCVWMPGNAETGHAEFRQNRMGEGWAYFPTLAEAKAHLVSEIKAEVMANELILAGARERLSQAMAIEVNGEDQ